MSQQTQPWDRWPGEPEIAFEAFCGYVQLGWPHGPGGLPTQRLLTVLARRTGRDLAWLRDCLHTWQWRDRAYAYDAAVQRARDAAVFDAAYDATRTQLAIIAGMERALLNETEKALEQSLSEGPIIRAAEIASALEKIAKTRALIEGRPTEHVQVNHGYDLDALSAEELLTLSALLSKGKAEK